MTDFTSYRNNPDSLGRKLRVLDTNTLPASLPNRAKVVWTKADTSLSIADADGTNPVTGLDEKAGVPLKFVPELITAMNPVTVIYYTL
jgi:hypothetical protein